MTKVWINEYFLAYQKGMVEFVRQIVKEKYIAGVRPDSREEPPWVLSDLLPPPKVESIDLDFYEGGLNDFISIYTSDDFGIVNLFLTMTDESGNLIESGNAVEWPEQPNRWAFFTQVHVHPVISVTVQAFAIDGFGAMSSRSERKTLNHDI